MTKVKVVCLCGARIGVLKFERGVLVDVWQPRLGHETPTTSGRLSFTCRHLGSGHISRTLTVLEIEKWAGRAIPAHRQTLEVGVDL